MDEWVENLEGRYFAMKSTGSCAKPGERNTIEEKNPGNPRTTEETLLLTPETPNHVLRTPMNTVENDRPQCC